MTEMTYNNLSGWVKVDRVRVGQNRPTGRVLRIPMEQKHQGLPAHKVVKEELWIWGAETGIDPVGDIVHLNGDPFDNRWRNLRDGSDMETEAGKDCLLTCDLEWRFRNQDKHLNLDYRQESGEIVYLNQSGASAVIMVDDRPVVFFAGEWFAAEDVAWFLGTGVWPERGVRIVNGEYNDLKLSNLRRIV